MNSIMFDDMKKRYDKSQFFYVSETKHSLYFEVVIIRMNGNII